MDPKRLQQGRAPRPVDGVDAERRREALVRLRAHADRELFFLELAVRTGDDGAARWLEARADDAYRDALAIAAEHGLRW